MWCFLFAWLFCNENLATSKRNNRAKGRGAKTFAQMSGIHFSIAKVFFGYLLIVGLTFLSNFVI